MIVTEVGTPTTRAINRNHKNAGRRLASAVAKDSFAIAASTQQATKNRRTIGSAVNFLSLDSVDDCLYAVFKKTDDCVDNAGKADACESISDVIKNALEI